jgi:hypothetical protein
VRVPDARTALREAAAIQRDRARREAMGAKATEFVAAHRGAVSRVMAWLGATVEASRERAPG